MAKPGPVAGSEGARKIAEAHRGSHDHDKEGGFAANPELAREAGRKGGETVKNRYGASFYQSIGKKGGETVKRGARHRILCRDWTPGRRDARPACGGPAGRSGRRRNDCASYHTPSARATREEPRCLIRQSLR